MPQSRLFVSSVSRSRMARRRQRGPRPPLSRLVLLALIVAAALVVAAARVGL